MTLRLLSNGLLLLSVAGCAPEIRDIGKEPALTPVGSGLQIDRAAMIAPPIQQPVYGRGNSFWQDSAADLFRDARAIRVGDVVTVKISIKDQASLANSTNRSRQSSSDQSYKVGWGADNKALKSTHLQTTGDANVSGTLTGDTSTKGDGAIKRSETIDLLVAAVVTDVLPNGNLVISGKQEVRVNYEVRDLAVAGVVRPRDISTENSISYDKIAEARISYGGRGRVTEVQQPAWGQQVWDRISPF